MKKYVLIFILFFSVLGLSQSDEEKAFVKFKEARSAFIANNYSKSARLLKEVKDLLGSTNIRIQPMYIKSLVGIKDWRKAKSEIQVYYGLNPDTSLVEYQEIIKIQDQVTKKISEEEADYSSAKSAKSVSKYQLYLDTYPYGKYRDEVKNLKSGQNDENAWSKAKSGGAMESYQAYIDKYPSGNHAEEAKRKRREIDENAYKKATSSGTQTSLNYYLNNYPNGQYRSEVQSKLKERKEYDVYQQARKSNSITDYETYIKKYPKGKYSSEVNQIIKNSYYRFATDYQKKKQWDRSKMYYQKYITKYPYADNVGKAKRKVKWVNYMIDAESARNRTYIDWHMSLDNENYLGLAIGGLKNQWFKFHFFGQVRLNIPVFTSTTYYTVDNYGNYDGATYADIRPTGEIRLGSVQGLVGVNMNVLPKYIWLYLGAGYGYHPYFIQVEEFNSSGSSRGKEWVRNTDATRHHFLMELGANFNIYFLNLRVGVATNTFENVYPTFSAGFSWD